MCREQKRALLVMDFDSTPSPIFQQHEFQSSYPSRFPSEDWVKQTDGLCIENASGMTRFHNAGDVNMVSNLHSNHLF